MEKQKSGGADRPRGKINVKWHDQNTMPPKATLAERARWHQIHAVACGCREMPESVKRYIDLRSQD
jgi:hypothetical protein